jgi:hypothetical protein
MTQSQNMSEDDYLNKHLSDLEHNTTQNNLKEYQEDQGSSKTSGSRTEDLQYLAFDINQLPCGEFYPQGTILTIRAAQVREIQSYSMVDDNNFYDVVEKMNDMLSSCVRLKKPDGTIGTYLDIKDQDRLYLVFLIRELTFQKGNSLEVKSDCTCGEEVHIELKRENFRFHKIEDTLKPYFDIRTNSFIFEIINNKVFKLTPPTIGIQKSFTDYIIEENNQKKRPNLSFLKIIPFMLEGRNSISSDGIKAKLQEYENIDDDSFQFLNSAVDKLTFGIKELSKTCSCGQEVHTEMSFPNGASGIFVIRDAFETLIKK